MFTKKRYSSIVEQVVTFYSYAKPLWIPSYEKDDLQQEIRLRCWIIYDKKKYPDGCTDRHLYNFLKVSIHNQLYNMQRGWRFPNSPPCSRCSLSDKRQRRCIAVGGAKNCNKHNKYWSLLNTKYNLKYPLQCGLIIKEESVKRFAYNYNHNNNI